MNDFQIVSRDEWLTARKELLAKEKELTHAWDVLRAERRAATFAGGTSGRSAAAPRARAVR